MNYETKLVKWLGLTGLAVVLAGCPGGDDGETGAETGPSPTTTTDPGTTTMDPGTTTMDPGTTTMDPGTTTAMDPDTTEGVTCDPPCEAGQECVDGVCMDMPADSSSGDPPAECGLPPGLMFPSPMCGECLEGSCCEQLQVCFGDETTMEMTDCLQLNNCVAMNCTMAMSLPDLEMCVDDNCADFSDALNDWLAYNTCAGMNCMAACS